MADADPDITWPLDGPDDEGRLRWSSGEASVRESLLNLLLTRPGERVMRPELGAGVTRFIHQSDDETTRGLLANEAGRAAQTGEPRIKVESVEAQADPDRAGRVLLSLRYRRLRDGGRDGLELGLDLNA